MSELATRRMIEVYNQSAEPTMFLSGLFRSPAQNFHNSEEIEVDIVRSDEDVSIVIQDLSTGYRHNDDDIYTNKAFKPPVHKESIGLNSSDLLKRLPGNNPFQSVSFRANVVSRMFDKMLKIERKIRRSIELQASQVMQTGIVTLTDTSGTELFKLDYKPKSAHFPTAGTTWGQVGATPLADLEALAEVIRNNGLVDPDELIFGTDAFDEFLQDSSVKDRFDTRRIDQGRISPMERRNNGGNYRGVVEIGNYRFDVWTYGGRYKHPQTGVKTQYVDPGKVIMQASTGRKDATFGAIPNIGRELGITGPKLIPELPGRISNPGGGMDLFTNAWISDDGEQLFGGVGSRPLMIPTAIDTYGCLDTGL